MTFQRQHVFWFCVAVVVILALTTLWSVILPFLVALIIAYLLDPMATRLERLGIGRLGATSLLIVGLVLALLLLFLLGIPAIIHQFGGLASRLPEYMTRLQVFTNEYVGPLLERFGGPGVLPDMQKSMGDIVGQLASWAGQFLSSVWSGGQALISIVSLMVITPVVAFYLLLDWPRMIQWIDTYLPASQRDTIWGLGREIDQAIDGFLRGQLLVCICLGAMYAFGLWLVGLNSGVPIGIVAGLISFIPYVGSLTGLVLAVGVAIGQFWPEWTMILATLSVFVVGQFIEGNILAPKLVGDSIGVHPVWLIFSLLAFGSLLGFGGLLIATPMAAIIGVLARFSLRHYMNSRFFLGEQGEAIVEKAQDE